MRKLFLLVLLVLPSSLLAQGGYVRDIVLQKQTLANPSITYAQPVVGALVRVCTGGGIPCTPLATIYSNATLTTVKNNPTSTDINGNFNFWATPGLYTVGITVNGVTTNFDYTVDYTNPASIGTNVGSSNQIIYNNGTIATGSQDFQWNDTTKVFTVATSGTPVVRLLSDGGAGKIIFSSGTAPYIRDSTGTGWFFTSQASQDFNLGTLSDPQTYIFAVSGGASGLSRGTVQLGNGSGIARINMNDGSGSAGVWAGATIIMGTVADPNGNITANQGSMFLTTAGGMGSTMWVKETGDDDMGWAAK